MTEASIENLAWYAMNHRIAPQHIASKELDALEEFVSKMCAAASDRWREEWSEQCNENQILHNTCGKSHALAVGCSDKSSRQTPQERIEMTTQKELPELPEPAVTNDDLKEMESKVDYWREKHADLGLKYDNLLQSFHIAETDAKLWKGTAEKARGMALKGNNAAWKLMCEKMVAQARDQAISETLSIAYGYADSLTWNDDFKAEVEALKGK